MVFILGSMAIDTKDSSKIVLNMEKGSNISLMEILIKEIIKWVNLRDMGSITGLVAVFSKEILKLGLGVARECGKKEQEEVISMKVNGSMIRKKDLGCLLGLMEVYIKDILLMISNKDKEKYCTRMELALKDNGKKIDLFKTIRLYVSMTRIVSFSCRML